MRAPSLMFGVPIDDLTMAETLDTIDSLVRDGRRLGRSHQIATVNVDFLVNALENPDLRSILQSSAVNLADGLPLVWGARAVGLPVAERVAGSDLVPLIAAEATQRKWRVHFFGSAPGVGERALERMLEQTPEASLTADAGPIMTNVRALDDPVINSAIETIRALDPDILCVALGNPKQEHFIATHAERLGVPVLIGIGGSLDMYVGDKKRAPRWAQRIGAEWVFRAAQEPGRLGRRYAHDATVFGPKFQSYARRMRRLASGAPLLVDSENDVIVVRTADGGVTGSSVVDLDQLAGKIGDGAAVIVDHGGSNPNPRALTELLAIVRLARRFGREVTVRNLSPATRHLFVDVLELGPDIIEGFPEASP